MTRRIRLVRVPTHESGAPMSEAFEALEELSRARSLETLGNGDFTDSAESYALRTTSNHVCEVAVLAIPDSAGMSVGELGDHLLGGGTVEGIVIDLASDEASGVDVLSAVGMLSVETPLVDNHKRADLDVYVTGAWRESGLPALLLMCAESIASHAGRSIAWFWTLSAPWADAAGAQVGSGSAQSVVPGVHAPILGAEGQASPMRTWSTDLLSKAGFRPEHTEWMSKLDVDRALISAPVPVPGYEVVSWTSPRSPEDLVDELAALYALASTDMPSGGLNEEPEVWDSPRVIDGEARMEGAGRDWVTTAVRPVGGELVGWTTLELTTTAHEVAYQEGTLVRGDHRGRGLAWWIKLVNLAELRAQHPHIERIYTWNDGSNTPVISMNLKLGFRPLLIEIGWEKQLAPAPTPAPRAR